MQWGARAHVGGMREFILYLIRSLSRDGPVARRDSADRTVTSPSVAGVWSSSRKRTQEAPRGFSAHQLESPRPIDYMKGCHSQCGFWRGPRGDGVYRRHRCDHRRLEARPPWAVAVKVGKKGDNPKEYDWTLCSGGPGDASGGSGRARGRLLRPARGRDGRMGRHANLWGGEGVKKIRRDPGGKIIWHTCACQSPVTTGERRM